MNKITTSKTNLKNLKFKPAAVFFLVLSVFILGSVVLTGNAFSSVRAASGSTNAASGKTAAVTKSDESDESTTAENYAMFCGSREDLLSMMKSRGEEVSEATESDFVELNKQREPLLKILKNGDSAIKEILAEGNKSDTGPLGVILACGILEQIKSEVIAKGCFDLASNRAFKNKQALKANIQACEAVLEKLNK